MVLVTWNRWSRDSKLYCECHSALHPTCNYIGNSAIVICRVQFDTGVFKAGRYKKNGFLHIDNVVCFKVYVALKCSISISWLHLVSASCGLCKAKLRLGKDGEAAQTVHVLTRSGRGDHRCGASPSLSVTGQGRETCLKAGRTV